MKLNLLIEIAGSPWAVGRGGSKIANALCKYDLALDRGYVFERLNHIKLNQVMQLTGLKAN